MKSALIRSAALSAVCLLAVPSLSRADLCLQNSAGTFVLSKVSSKISKAKGKPVGGYAVVPLVFNDVTSPLYGSAVSDTAQESLLIGFAVPRTGAGGSGFVNAGSTQFHQINFGDVDGVWDIGQTTNDCIWSDANGSYSTPSCVTTTAIDCATVVKP